MMKILIVDPVHRIMIDKLEEKGFQVSYQPEISPRGIQDQIETYEGLVIRSKMVIDQDVIDRAVNLRFIGRVGSGMENIDQGYAGKKNILCFNSPEGNRDAVGEHALGLLLSLINRIPVANRDVRSGIWDREANRGTEIKGKTIGIIGYGHTGSAFAEKLIGLGTNIIAYDKYKFNYGSSLVKEKTMEALFDEADVLSLHVPLTSETHYLVNNRFLKRFRKPILLINTSRGQVVQTEDLVENLKSGKITGAALDVLEYESHTFEELHKARELPRPLMDLARMDQVILTPHVAGWTHESYRKLSEIIANKILSNLF